ncbi:hypothetical protein V8C42DRAFT_356352 [Trichoderma barbatum]
MDRGPKPLTFRSRLPSPYSSSFNDHHSEGSWQNTQFAAHYLEKQDYRISVALTLEYSVYPPSAQSGSSLEHIQRSYHPSRSTSSGGMAQQHNNPFIMASSPTYPYAQHSGYAPNPDISHGYSHRSGGVFTQPGYSQHAPLTPGNPLSAQSLASAPQQTFDEVYRSFLFITNPQKPKRPRRRPDEIERSYKCSYDECDKAYGTLNHLNMHIINQSHGQKRTPEEFKGSRKALRRRGLRQRAPAANVTQSGGGDPQAPDGAPSSGYPTRPNQYPAPPSGNPRSSFGQPSQQNIYSQSANGALPPSHIITT